MACAAVTLSKRYRRAARAMLGELRSTSLVVSLAPSKRRESADRGGMIRVVLERNADWYRRLCKSHLSYARARSKPDTRIKRQDTIDALHHLVRTGCPTTTYQRRVAACIPGFLMDQRQRELSAVPF